MEVKQQDEEEESDTGSCSKGGKLSNLKTEEKPVKSEVKKEECSGEGGKGVPMDTSTTITPMASMKTEDRKPEVKKEVKEEEETSDTTTPQATVKKKSKEDLSFYQKTSDRIFNFLSSLCVCLCVYIFINCF